MSKAGGLLKLVHVSLDGDIALRHEEDTAPRQLLINSSKTDGNVTFLHVGLRPSS